MTKERIYFDQNSYQKEKQNLEIQRDKLQELLKTVNSIGDFEVKTSNELKLIAEKGSDGVKEILADRMEPPKVLGLPLKRRETVELMELPKDKLSEIDSLIGDIDHLNSDKFEIKNGNVQIPESLLQRIEDRNSIYAESREEQNLFEAHKEALKALEKLQKASAKADNPLFHEPRPGEGQRHLFNEFFLYKNGKVEINPSLYREIKRKNS